MLLLFTVFALTEQGFSHPPINPVETIAAP